MVEINAQIFDPKVMAKSIETFLEMFDRYVIKTDLTVEEYDKARKDLKKLIKKLKKGKLEDVIDPDRYADAVERYYASGGGY